MATAPRATSAHISLALSPAERAAITVELAGLSARVAALAARLDRLQDALSGPAQPAGTIRVVTAPITRVATVHTGHATPGVATAAEAKPWR
jgi:hypothetical protein